MSDFRLSPLKWKAIFIALLLLAIAALSARLGMHIHQELRYPSSDFDTHRRLRGLILLSQIAPLFHISALGLWGANKIFRMSWLSPTTFSGALIGIGAFMVLKFGLNTYDVLQYASSATDYSLHIFLFAEMAMDITILWLLSKDLKEPFIPSPVEATENNAISAAGDHTFARSALLGLAAIAFIATCSYYVLSMASTNAQFFKDPTKIFRLMMLITYAGLPVFLALCLAHFLKVFTLSTLNKLRKALVIFIPIITLVIFINPALQIYANRDKLEQWLFGDYPIALSLSFSFSSTLTLVLLLVVMMGSLNARIDNMTNTQPNKS